jgi:hypothetical protein
VNGEFRIVVDFVGFGGFLGILLKIAVILPFLTLKTVIFTL